MNRNFDEHVGLNREPQLRTSMGSLLSERTRLRLEKWQRIATVKRNEKPRSLAGLLGSAVGTALGIAVGVRAMVRRPRH